MHRFSLIRSKICSIGSKVLDLPFFISTLLDVSQSPELVSRTIHFLELCSFRESTVSFPIQQRSLD